MPNCKDCGKSTKGHGERCHSCAAKRKWARGDYDSPEYRRKQSESTKEAWGRGKLGNPEYRHKLSAAMQDPEYRRKQSENTKKAWARGIYDSPEYRRKISEASKVAWTRLRRRYHDKQSEAMKKIMRSSEYRRKQSKAMKKAWARGDFDNPEYRRKQSKNTKTAWARGDHDESRDSPEYRRKMSEAVKEAWERGDYDGVFTPPYKSTEVPLMAALDICGIEHTSQYRPDGCRFTYDEFVPPNILIEANGDYWHSTKKAKKRDAEKAIWAKDNGYHLVIIWEREIQEQGAWSLVHGRILPLLATTPKRGGKP